MHEISSLFSGKNKKNIIDMSSAEFAHSMVSVEAPVTKIFILQRKRGLIVHVNCLPSR